MLQEFRDFVTRGNIVDLAVAVVMATFFAPIITSIVDGVLLQIVAAIFGEPDFSALSFSLGDADIRYGEVITAIINFVIVAAAIFFIVVKPMNAILAKEEEEEDAGPSETDLLAEIRDELRQARGA